MALEQLYETHQRLINSIDTKIQRYLYHEINWENRLIAITGQRGVGKTTLLLQRVQESEKDSLYLSADSLFIYKLGLFEIALNFYKQGGKTLFIDEIHKYPNWSGEVKHIYDALPSVSVVFTGSSILDLVKGYGDLSRRAVHYSLQGLSFREYLEFELGVKFSSYTLAEVFMGKVNLKLNSPLLYFNQYLAKGYYPFYKEPDYELKLLNVVNIILEVDIVQYLDLKSNAIAKLKKLLQIIAESVPFKPNISKIAQLSGIQRSQLLDYLSYLEKAGLIHMLSASTKGIQALGKPEKIYLNNPNLSFVLAANRQSNLGNIRETFFMSQLIQKYRPEIPKIGDFIVDGKTIEIGGKGKTGKQIKQTENPILVKDDIEFAYKNTIPLWHFGFLY